jgi:hypothetical protein
VQIGALKSSVGALSYNFKPLMVYVDATIEHDVKAQNLTTNMTVGNSTGTDGCSGHIKSSSTSTLFKLLMKLIRQNVTIRKAKFQSYLTKLDF